MKLLNCLECHDIQLMKLTVRRCACGKSEGSYDQDGDHATYSGPARILGINNRDYVLSIKFGVDGPMQIFVIPKESGKIRKATVLGE